MLERIKQMLIKEFIQLFRDPKMRAVIFIIPIVQTLLFGYAVTTDVRNIYTYIYDQDNSMASRLFVSAFAESGYFTIGGYLSDDQMIEKVLDSGKATVVLHIKKDFEGQLRSGKQAEVQAIIDGTDSNTAGIIEDYITRIFTQLNQKYLPHPLVKMKLKSLMDLDLESRAWFNENLESRNYFVPGVLATIITLATLTLTSMAIVREKEIGTIEQILVTPITKFEFILGKTVPFILIGFLDAAVILAVALFWFEIPLRGSIALLFFSVGLYLMTTLGIGLFISTISQTQQQAMMGTFLFYFPVVLLSGFLFPIANMPKFIQWITMINPLKYFIIIIRNIFLKGVGLEILWPHILTLGIMGILTFWLATRSFRKTMV